MDHALTFFAVLAALTVLVHCIVRINLMVRRHGGVLWFAVYVCFAVSALGVLCDALRYHYVPWHGLLGLLGTLLYLVLTARRWSSGEAQRCGGV